MSRWMASSVIGRFWPKAQQPLPALPKPSRTSRKSGTDGAMPVPISRCRQNVRPPDAGRRNVNSELEEIARRKVKIRDGDKEREMSLLAANFYAHAIKGAKGDTRSAGLVFNLADRAGLMNSEDGADNVLWREHIGGVALGRNSATPSSVLFENL